MWTVGFLVMFFGLLAAGMPIFLVLGVCAAILFYVSGQPMIGVAQNMIDQLNSTTLMALPLFVMAAAFMRRGGVAQALVDLSAAWLGGIKGSLGLVAVVSCALFAAISGSSVATALAMGTILLPAMLRARLSARLRIGRAGRIGNHRRGDPAITGTDPVRYRHRAVGAAAVPGGHPAGPVAGRSILPVGAVLRAAEELPC